MPSFIATPHHNFKTSRGRLAKGCELCVKGEKMVLFVTGVCGNGCPYCPVSDAKNLKDVVFANESAVKDDKDILKEAMVMDASGAGITGGDPLAVMDRTVRSIRLLKRKFGKSFHIHLYTPLLRASPANLKRLFDAGLDEIRFHPKLDDPSLWPRLLEARKYSWSVGVEIPVLPVYERRIMGLFDYLADHDVVDFVNLNEFEYADNAVFERAGSHYEPKSRLSYAVKGSLEAGKRILSHAQRRKVPAHLCTAKSKDAVQLAKRLERRAKNAARPYDDVDDEGLLSRGAVYDRLDITVVRYLEKLAALSSEEKTASLSRLRVLRKRVMNGWDVPAELIALDAPRLRLLTSVAVAQALAKELVGHTIALVKEYPTDDCFLVEADVLRKKNVGA
jgi:pyruvate formate-lyase activating enzyme-like uncharacterized protein